MRNILIIIFVLKVISATGQGYNHTWLLGYGNWANKARINFDTLSYQFIIEQRNMGFYGTQGNISDENGNFLMSSNGVYIANANNDTMQNGAGLNPGTFVNNWEKGLPLPYANIILPWPDSTHKFVLIHHTSPSEELYYTVIDITLDNGLGAVVEKNTVFFQDYFAWGISACKHANGRDWWIVAISDSANKIFTFLLTPGGIQFHNAQIFNVPTYSGSSVRPNFSPDGKKFAYTAGTTINGNVIRKLYLYNFDRCTGNFSNPKIIDTSDSLPGASTVFSPNSKYLYTSSVHKTFQIDTDTTDVIASLKVVAVNDTFYSPFTWCCLTDFWLMYLAANGKIYITSGSSVQHHHFINYPDLEDTLCDVQQHALYLNGVYSYRAVPNHPNYYLGCDVSCTPCLVSNDEINHDFRFNIYPNPSNGNFNIIYLLPQNKEGKLEIIDITGKVVYTMRLPQWSTLQNISLPSFISNGLYSCVITSDNQRISKKIAIQR